MTNNSPEKFDISTTLRKRLEEIKHQKAITQKKLNASQEQLQKLIKKAKNKKSRDSPESLERRADELEERRTTSSLSLAEEKDILRQISVAKKTSVENRELNNSLQEQKAETNELRNTLRSTVAQIAELEGAISKVDLASRLGCSASALENRIVDCPLDKLGMVIGKNGSGIKKLEKMSGCLINIDKTKNQIHLQGSEEAINNAMIELDNIILSVEESFELSDAIHSHLFGKQMTPFQNLKKEHPNVYFDLSKDSKIMKLRGRKEFVTTAMEVVNKIDVTMHILKLKGKESALVIGKNGVTISGLVDTFDVSIQMSKKSEELSTAKIIGCEGNVNRAVEKIESMIFLNEEIETSVVVSSISRNNFLSNSGAAIKALQKDVSKACDDNVFIRFEKLSEGDYKAASTILIMKAARCIIEKVEDLVRKSIQECEANTVTMNVDPELMPKIIGKGGEVIKKLRTLAPGCEIEVNKITGEIKLLTADEVARNKIKDEIDEIVAANQVLRIPVDESFFPSIFGSTGKEVRGEMQNIGVSILNDPSNKIVTLRGTVEKTTEAAAMLRDFMLVNHKLEVGYDRDDQDSLLQRGSDSILKKLSSSYGVLTNLVRSQCIVVITGKENDIQSAKEELQSYLYGGNGISVIKVFAPTEVLGALIGKGGSNLKKLEKDFHPVKLNVMRTTKRICIRGPEENVHQCRGKIVQTIMTQQISETLQLGSTDFEKLSVPAVKRKIFNGLPSEQLILRPGSARLRGTYFDIQELQFQLEEIITDEYKTVVRLETSQFESVKNQLELEQISDTTGAKLEIDQSKGGILIAGKRAYVKRAKNNLLGALELLLPRQFCRVKILKPIIRNMRHDERVTSIAVESGCSLSIDQDLNCVIIQNSTVSDATKGVTAIEALLKKYEELNYVLRIDRNDAWLVNLFIDKGGAIIKTIEKESGCGVRLWRDELLISASGNEKDCVQKAKDMILTVVEKAKRETMFVDLPESALSEFIGRAGSHLSGFSNKYNVEIQRVKKLAKFKISGEENAVSIAVSRISDWLNNWEGRNPGIVINLSEKEIARLDDYPLFLKGIEQQYRVKTDMNRSFSSITIRGDNSMINENAEEKIRAFIVNLKETEEEPVNNGDTVENSVDKPGENFPESDSGKENVNANYDSVPTGVTVKNSSKKETDKKPSGSMNSNASSLLNLLISSNEALDNPDENWDSSTVSSTNESDVFNLTESLSNNEMSHFRSKSGFSVRL